VLGDGLAFTDRVCSAAKKRSARGKKVIVSAGPKTQNGRGTETQGTTSVLCVSGSLLKFSEIDGRRRWSRTKSREVVNLAERKGRGNWCSSVPCARKFLKILSYAENSLLSGVKPLNDE
jgi:hypothetical protein